MNIGVPELLIVLAIILLVFGPKRLPMLGKQLGSGMREFKDSITGKSREDEPDQVTAAAPATTVAAEPVDGEVVGDRRA